MAMDSDKLLILEETEGSSQDDTIELVPLSSASELLDHSESQLAALQRAQDEFQQAYNHAPQYVARAPGRVNLIGEHIDYNGFGVLPMALQQSVFCAVSCRQSQLATTTTDTTAESTLELHIQSTSPQAPPCRVQYNVSEILDRLSQAESSSNDPPFLKTQEENFPDWSHYVLCAIFGILQQLQETHPTQLTAKLHPQHTTICFLIHGTVPQGAGVSSSSALVVASAMATVTALLSSNNSSTSSAITKTQMAALCARCERWVGTEGGGMDQAISIFGRLQYIQFQPTLAHASVSSLPLLWVVCHSLQESHKRVDAALYFNKRVVECKVACRWLAHTIVKKNDNDTYPTLLWELVRQSNLSFSELEAVTKEKIPETVTRAELERFVLGATTEEHNNALVAQLASQLGIARPAGMEVLKVAESYSVRDRLLHVLSEARRVQAFRSLCGGPADNNANNNKKDAERQVGTLLNQSHASCSDWYQCSSRQLDQLQHTCQQAPGALGSRMTGAGWGGCVVALVSSNQVDEFCQFVRTNYYADIPDDDKPTNESDYMFVTQPSPGSNVFESN
ncbi:acetylgalactosamine kinase [Seminavis robusta]|uniref:Acetylgalactosamine kinase n=1 Tax=Seminavis robusta TaxID=568900 RepID=A0A9N8HW40_9STRA|nr:acetylgalactosamine kinase [Seminavis robusta]|eukprot:Sro2077_g313580.1 acetylgalactosamine kinase (565) ;mRNA; r:8548-10242